MASHWIPQDDFLLRKSIENGASLESLAKGAVKFSRKFTLSELTERWHSLLYDPNVNSLSSSLAFEDQHSSMLLPQTHTNQPTRVRTQYYTARKRMRLEEILNEEVDHNAANVEAVDEDFNNVAAFGDMGFDDFFDLGFDASDIDNYHNSFLDVLQDDHGFDQPINHDDDMMVNQLLNVNDGHIQDTTEHVLVQEEFQNPMIQQPPFIDTTSSVQEEFQNPMIQQPPFIETTLSQQLHHSDQGTTWFAPGSSSHQDLPTEPVAHCYVPMSLSELDPHPEIKNGVIICVLNKASEEYPDNHDFKPQLNKQKTQNPKKHMKPPLPPPQVRLPSLPQGRDCDVKAQASCSYASKDAEKTTCSFAATTSTSLQHSIENLNVDMDINVSMSEAYVDNNETESGVDNNEIESGEDLPSYSDVEAMILDMDLEPVVQNRYEMEVAKYQNEKMARKIMRLEQSFNSYMNRDIASHGAFAILYGSSRHYIKKPEVVLGRATEENHVDIDLGRLESGTKVSRKQAEIKLKPDGSFEIKNHGKVSIWMNNEEIVPKEIANLKNNCLLQIRHMSFIFEVNEKAVKRYLDETQKRDVHV